MLASGLPTAVLGGGLLVVCVLLFTLSQGFRYYAKFLVFFVLSIIFATIFIPLMLFRPKNYKNALLPAWGARQISKLLNLKWKLRGHENIINDTGCVVLINHQSALDLLVLAELWPVLQRCTVISKREIFYAWPFGLAAWLWGTIFINRLNGEKAQSAINKTGETIRTKQAKLCMFPEGTRHSGKELLPFKKGAFHVAIAAQTPILPVVVSHYHFLDDKEHRFDAGTNIIEILPPISTEGLIKEDIDDLISRTYSAMSQAFIKLSNEVLIDANETNTES